MLQFIREKTTGWFAWVIVILIALVFVLFGIRGFGTNHSANNKFVKINDQKIPQYIIDEFKKLVPNLDFIHEVAKKQELTKLGFNVNNAEIKHYVTEEEMFHKSAKPPYQLFLELKYRNPGLYNILYKYFNFKALNEQLSSTFNVITFPLLNENLENDMIFNQKRDINILTLDPVQYKDKAQVNEQEINNYYNKHQNKFFTPQKIKLNYIELNLQAVKQKINATDKEIKDFYNENLQLFIVNQAKRHVLQIALRGKNKQKLTEIEKQLASNPKIFSELAKKYSADISAKDGGDSGWFYKNDMPNKTIRETVFSLKLNQISSAIKTKDTIYIFKVIGLNQDQISPFAQVKASAKDKLITQKANQKFAKLQETLANITYENIDSLQPAANELNLPIKKSDWIYDNNDINKIKQNFSKSKIYNPQVIKAAFSEEVLQDGENSQLIAIGKNDVIVIRKNRYESKKLKTLSQVNNQIKDILLQQKAQQYTKNIADKIYAIKINDGDQKISLQNFITTARKIAPQLSHIVKNQFKIVNIDNTTSSAKILIEAFKIPVIKDKNNIIGISKKLLEQNNKFYILLVNNIQITPLKNIKTNDPELKQFASQYELVLKLYLESKMIHNIKNNAKIVYS